MLKYFDCYKNENNVIYSVDMLRFRFYCDDSLKQKICDFVSSNFNYDIYRSAKSFGYSVLLDIKCNNAVNHFVIGLGFNGLKKSESRSCFIEFNPNKVGSSFELSALLDFMFSLSLCFVLVLYDLAVDLPFSKKYISLIKDRRVYKKFVYDSEGVNVTEYLGSGADAGRIKLYNKSIESDLDYDLTRLELTTRSLDYLVVSKQFPKLLVCGFSDSFYSFKLSKTDLVLLELLYTCDDPSYYFKRLGKDKQKVLLPFVSQNFDLGFNEEVFSYLLKIINFFKNFKKSVDI